MAERVCGYCGRPLPADARRNRRFCSRVHKREALRERRRREEVHARLVTTCPPYGDLTLTELHDRAPLPRHSADRHASADLSEFSDEYDLGLYEQQDDDGQDYGIFTADAQPGYSPDSAFRDQMEFASAVDGIRRRYAVRLRPYEDALRRNPGVKPLGMARLEQARDAEIQELTRARQRAEAMALAAQDQPYRRASAHERATEHAALRALSRDLPGSPRRHTEPHWSGRGTQDIAIW